MCCWWWLDTFFFGASFFGAGFFGAGFYCASYVGSCIDDLRNDFDYECEAKLDYHYYCEADDIGSGCYFAVVWTVWRTELDWGDCVFEWDL